VNAIITMSDSNATQEDVRVNYFNCCEVIHRGGTILDWATDMGLETHSVEVEDLPF